MSPSRFDYDVPCWDDEDPEEIAQREEEYGEQEYERRRQSRWED